MKHTLKRFAALLLALVLLTGLLPTVLADGAELTNLAKTALISATDSMPGGGLYDPAYLIDGMLGNYPAEQQLGWCVTGEAEVTAQLLESSVLSKIILYPITFESGKFFPSAYTVFVSENGTDWTKVGEATDIPNVGTTPQEITLDQVRASYVKISVDPRSVVETNGSISVYAQLAELEIWGHAVPAEPILLSAGKGVTATDSMPGGGLYDPAYLTDGKLGNYPAEQQLGWCTTMAADATISLDGICKVSKVVLYPITFESGKFFPSSYTVYVSENGTEWTEVGTASDVPNVGTTPQTVTFQEIQAAYVKVHVEPRSVLEANGSTSVYAQLGELEIYGFEVEAEPAETTLGLHDYDLEGYPNLALYKEGVTASDDNAHDGKAAKNVTDGILTDTEAFGWDTYGSNGIAWLQIDLEGVCQVQRVVVYPFWTSTAVGEFFPAEYELQLSMDGEVFTTVDTYKNPNPTGNVTGAVVHDLEETSARYVRINVTKTVPKAGQAGLRHSQIGEINVYGFSRDLKQYDPYVPYGSVYTNLALEKNAVATDDNAQWGMAAANTTDGLLTTSAPYGWSTNQTADPATGVADLTVDLEQLSVVQRFVVYPFYIGQDVGVYFPRAYDLQVSTDGKIYTTVVKKEGNESVVRPQIIDLEQAVEARYVRIHVTSGGYNPDSDLPYCTQLGEISVYGIYNSNSAVINKTALRMTPGDIDYLKITYYGIGEAKVTYTSKDTSVATVTENGRVAAVDYGETTIHVADATSGTEYDVTVLVDDYVATEHLMITAFWPIQDYNINDAYLDTMKEAGITNIQLNFVLNTANYADNMTIAQMAYARGMGITVSEKNWGWGKIASFSDEKIYEEALKYSHVPGVIGYYVIDEPGDASQFAHCFAPIKKAMPTADVHLNFIPNMTNYTGLLDLVGTDLDYLMWDSYIYPNQGILEANLFNVSNQGRELALQYGVKTAQFIQSCGFNGAFRKPNGNEIRYNVNAALAYGNKQIAYFTYRIPEGVGETFTSAIVNADGTKTEIFDDVAEINAAALQMGPTLMSVEALEVYHTGAESGANNPLPADFFLQPVSSSDRGLIVSYMKNLQTSQNYVMLVNRDYENAATVSFTAAEAAGALQYVSQEDGSLKNLTGGSVELAPGGCILIKTADSFDYTPDYGKFVETPAGENAATAQNTTVQASGTNKGQLTDGARISNTYTDGCGLPGYTASVGEGHTITLDFGGAQTLNRVDLYPGNADRFPSSFVLEGSADGNTWTELAKETAYVLPENLACSLTFEAAQYQYLRLTVLATESGDLQICELEAYNDDGTVPALRSLNGAVPVDKDLRPADNLARGAVVSTSSDHPAGAPYWTADKINDGVSYDAIFTASNAGWSSDPSGRTATQAQWVAYDLGQTKSVNKVVVYNAWHDRGEKKAECYPADYMIQVSNDGTNWTNVVAVYNDTNWTEVGARVFEFDAVNARYVRFFGERLGRCGDGFCLQLSELEVYGSDAVIPVDKTALNEAIAAAEARVEDDYTTESWAAVETALAAAKEAAKNAEASQEDVDTAAKALMDAVAALVVRPSINKDALNKAIKAAEALSEDDYTDSSWDAMQAALANAKAVAADADASQEKVDKAAENLNAAVDALVKKAPVYPVIPGKNPVKPDKKPADTFAGTFQDVNPGDWYYDSVKFVHEKGLFYGVTKTLFQPNTDMSRGMLVTVLYRLEGMPAVHGTSGFKDVAPDAYYCDAVLWAKNNGIITGTTKDTFNPDGNITREQMATILYRYAKYIGMDVSARADLDQYTDADQISSYAREAVSWAVAVGLITGRTATTLVADGTATRAEVATILMRFENLLK